MVSARSFIVACAFALTISALPFPDAADAPCEAITAQELQEISSATASCTEEESKTGECADAARAAPAINRSFEKYGIQTPGEQAALIALMIFESGSFKYNKNHHPGVPGQGTRNMQSPAYNAKYATDLFGADVVSQAQAAGGVEAVLQLVSGDDESFGSAAWFLATQCSQDQKTGLASGSYQGWVAYLTSCIGTTDTPERDAGWQAAKKVLNVGGQ